MKLAEFVQRAEKAKALVQQAIWAAKGTLTDGTPSDREAEENVRAARAELGNLLAELYDPFEPLGLE